MNPATSPRQGMRLAVLALAMLLPSLGTSIVNVALPDMARDFGADFAAVQWVVLAYLLALSAFIVGAGRLGDLFGRRRLLLAGIGLFAMASAAAALANGLGGVVAARAAQGLGAALMMALAVASVGDLVPRDRAGSAMGLLGTVSAVGTALGPTLGGALVAAFGWPAVFVALAAAGGLAAGLAGAVLPAEHRQPGRVEFDTAGLVLLAVALAGYALALTRGGSSPGFRLAMAGVAGLAAAGFLWVEARSRAPLIQPGLLADRALAAGLASSGLVATVLMATLVVGPFYLAGSLQLDPLRTGLVMSVGPVVSALCGVPGGRAVDRFGPQRVMRVGLAGVFGGSVLMVLLPGQLGWPGYAGSLAVMTSGYALFQAANNTAVMARAPGEGRGLVSGLLGLSRNLGLVTGASAMGALFVWGRDGAGWFGAGWFGAGGEAGLRLTFLAAAGLALLALGITFAPSGARPR